LNYAFALIGSDYTISQMNSFDAELYPRFTNLKPSTSGLKVFISVGGWAAGGKIFSDMVGSASKRATFIASALKFMATFSFDGKITLNPFYLRLVPFCNVQLVIMSQESSMHLPLPRHTPRVAEHSLIMK
jgi:hypothetical protein